MRDTLDMAQSMLKTEDMTPLVASPCDVTERDSWVSGQWKDHARDRQRRQGFHSVTDDPRGLIGPPPLHQPLHDTQARGFEPIRMAVLEPGQDIDRCHRGLSIKPCLDLDVMRLEQRQARRDRLDASVRAAMNLLAFAVPLRSGDGGGEVDNNGHPMS